MYSVCQRSSTLVIFPDKFHWYYVSVKATTLVLSDLGFLSSRLVFALCLSTHGTFCRLGKIRITRIACFGQFCPFLPKCSFVLRLCERIFFSCEGNTKFRDQSAMIGEHLSQKLMGDLFLDNFVKRAIKPLGKIFRIQKAD